MAEAEAILTFLAKAWTLFHHRRNMV